MCRRRRGRCHRRPVILFHGRLSSPAHVTALRNGRVVDSSAWDHDIIPLPF
ncbi:hypothetical protein HMPREF1861_02202 [Corynebacterium kroppenstedtii]|nr:hypothetical protein HMPREF1861_02202 [Corynebacterium kroppenstedtii]